MCETNICSHACRPVPGVQTETYPWLTWFPHAYLSGDVGFGKRHSEWSPVSVWDFVYHGSNLLWVKVDMCMHAVTSSQLHSLICTDPRPGGSGMRRSESMATWLWLWVRFSKLPWRATFRRQPIAGCTPRQCISFIMALLVRAEKI